MKGINAGKALIIGGFSCLLIILASEPRADYSPSAVLNDRIMEQGDNFIHGFTYYKGYLWASTRTDPCRILKIDPDTLNYERIELGVGFNNGEDLIGVDGYIWVILNTTPTQIISVDTETMEWESTLTFKKNELWRGGSLEYAFGHLWAGGHCGKIAKINLGDMSYQIYDYSSAVGDLQFHALKSGGEYLWASSPDFEDHETETHDIVKNKILRIDPHNPSDYASVSLYDDPICDDMAYVDGSLFVGSEKSTSYIYKINNDLTWSVIKVSDTDCYGVFTKNDKIWGVFRGSPGKIVRYDLNLNIKATYFLPAGFNNANEIAFDPSGGLLYITCWDCPAKILKIVISESLG